MFFLQFKLNEELLLSPDDNRPYIAIVGDPYDSPTFAIVAEAVRVTEWVNRMEMAVCMLMATYYVINFEYPKSKHKRVIGNYMYEFLQKILLEVDSSKLSQRMTTLYEKIGWGSDCLVQWLIPLVTSSSFTDYDVEQ